MQTIQLNGYTGEPVFVSEKQIHDVYECKLASSLLSGINCSLFAAMHRKSNKDKICNALKAL